MRDLFATCCSRQVGALTQVGRRGAAYMTMLKIFFFDDFGSLRLNYRIKQLGRRREHTLRGYKGVTVSWELK